MYKRHTVNLLDKFSPNDVVLFRFSLFSDPATVAWGWAVDNVNIQEAATDPLGIEEDIEKNLLSM